MGRVRRKRRSSFWASAPSRPGLCGCGRCRMGTVCNTLVRESRGKPSGPPPCLQGVVGYTTLAPAAAVVLRAGASGTTIARYRYVLRAGANKAWRYLFAGANVVYLTPPGLEHVRSKHRRRDGRYRPLLRDNVTSYILPQRRSLWRITQSCG